MGARIGLRATRSDPATLLSYLPPGASSIPADEVDILYSLLECARGTRPSTLYVGEAVLIESTDPAVLRAKLEGDVHYRIALAARDRVLVHAGVVAIGGVGVVMPGRTFAGKSSLVTHLVEAGAVYFSDELALFDDHGYVHPYPRPLRLRARGPEGLPAREVSVARDRIGRDPVPVGLIVSATYQPDGRWAPTVLAPGEAVLALFDNTILARERPGESLASLARVVQGAISVAGPRGEAAAVGNWIRETLSRRR